MRALEHEEEEEEEGRKVLWKVRNSRMWGPGCGASQGTDESVRERDIERETEGAKDEGVRSGAQRKPRTVVCTRITRRRSAHNHGVRRMLEEKEEEEEDLLTVGAP